MTPTGKYTLPKAERLSSKKQIALLFKAGQSFFISPVQVVYMLLDGNHPAGLQVAFTASKRKLPLAVHRNRIKRLLRESYRLQNGEIKKYLIENKLAVAAVFIYTNNRLTTFNEIENKINLVLKRLHADIGNN